MVTCFECDNDRSKIDDRSLNSPINQFRFGSRFSALISTVMKSPVHIAVNVFVYSPAVIHFTEAQNVLTLSANFMFSIGASEWFVKMSSTAIIFGENMETVRVKRYIIDRPWPDMRLSSSRWTWGTEAALDVPMICKQNNTAGMIVWVWCCFMTPYLSKVIQCRVWPSSFPCLHITRSDIRPHTKKCGLSVWWLQMAS